MLTTWVTRRRRVVTNLRRESIVIKVEAECDRGADDFLSVMMDFESKLDSNRRRTTMLRLLWLL